MTAKIIRVQKKIQMRFSKISGKIEKILMQKKDYFVEFHITFLYIINDMMTMNKLLE